MINSFAFSAFSSPSPSSSIKNLSGGAMKRGYSDGGGGSGSFPDKGKVASTVPEPEDEVDELLAALGYKVRASDMADVAQKLEQLEMFMTIGSGGFSFGPAASSGGSADDGGYLAHLAGDTVHYNPSDISNWVDNMLSEFNAPLPQLPAVAPPAPAPERGLFDLPLAAASSVDAAESSTLTTAAGYDLHQFQPSDQFHDAGAASKRMRTGTSSSTSSSSSSVGGRACSSAAAEQPPQTASVVLVDPQEAGIRLVHALLACAEAVQADNFPVANAWLRQIPVLAASQGGAMRKVAAYFGEALARRIYTFRPSPDSSPLDSAFADILHAHFYESCPYLKFAHFTANQAILEAFTGCRRVHVVDFGIKQGMQWPALLQALALRPGGPPLFRLTGIGPAQPDDTDALQQVGWKLAQFARTIHVDFHYSGLVADTLADLEPFMLTGTAGADDETEAVAVNSVFELHRLLARPGALEKVLGTVRAVRPKIVTVVEQEANHNAGSFLDRFTESLHYYSTMFDSLEGTAAGEPPAPGVADQAMSEIYLGRQICNVVACEGSDRTERHEPLTQWRTRLTRAGFEPVHLGSNAFKQASTLLALFAGGDGYRVDEKDGCLTLGWHTRPLISTSAWRAVAA